MNNLKSIDLYIDNVNLICKLSSEDCFIFSDEFLNVTFIEIKDMDYKVIDIYKGNIYPNNLKIIKYSPENNFMLYVWNIN